MSMDCNIYFFIVVHFVITSNWNAPTRNIFLVGNLIVGVSYLALTFI